MKITFNILSFFLLLSIETKLYCQTKIIIHENTTQHNNSNNNTNLRTRADDKAIKMNISTIFRGDYSISYEQKIYQDFSVELGLGIAYYDALFEEGLFFNYSPNNLVHNKREYLGGPSIKAAGKWYPSSQSEGITGVYLGLEGSYRKYNSEILDYTSTKIKEFNIHKDFRTFFGYQDVGWNDYILWDVTFGFGYRVHDRKYLGWVDNQSGYQQSVYVGNKNYPFFFIGLKAGFLFD